MTQSGNPKHHGDLVYCDNFDRNLIDESKWIAKYLPHWTTSELAIPRHHFESGHLVLRLDIDQSPWCPEHDGGVKCSSIQTGHFSGPLGAANGQLRFNKKIAGFSLRSRVTTTY